MEDDEGEGLGKMVEHEELIWELWLRGMMIRLYPTRHDYEEWLRIRANRTPEDWYGTPTDDV